MLLEAIGLNVASIVQDVTVHFDQGESVAIVGPNGAGKTTLLRAIAGLDGLKHHSLDQGWIRIRGADLSRIEPKRRALSIAYVGEDLALDFNWSLEEVVLMGRFASHAIWGALSSESQSLLDTLYAWFDMDNFRHRPFRSLSSGERQLGLVIRALYQRSSMVIFDETTSKIDMDRKQMVVAWVRQDHACRGSQSFVWVDHDHRFLSSIADRMLLMRQGQLVFDGPAAKGFEPEILGQAYQKKIVVPT